MAVADGGGTTTGEPVMRAWIVLVLLARAAHADDDLDGDDDIDAQDRALLEAAEQIEIVDKSDGQVLRESARAVTVIDTREARERAADLGEVLSRAQGIQVRRTGGLGSATRFSLNGLYDAQIRFFLDGVPLALAGWGLGIANVPVELVQRIDVHRGVVPIALGADALGGAIDLVTDPSWVDRAAASYQTGSFGTHRATLTARARDRATGLALGLGAFFDHADNDYLVDVEIPDAQGQLHPARVRRFHDAYTAAGTSIELGLVERGPVRRALARLLATDSRKELQHNIVMTVPYGDARYGESARGGTLDVALERGSWRTRLVAGATRRAIDFADTGDQIFDWHGMPIGERRSPGELGIATDQRVRETGVFARLLAEKTLGTHHVLRAAIAPTSTLRTGDDHLDTNPAGRDPISAQRDLHQLVGGLEHELRIGPVQNFAFVKSYGLWTRAEDVRAGFTFVPLAQSSQHAGLGDALRVRVHRDLAVKLSYEWATRLPAADELFGDGILIEPNLALAPERSHNANLGARYERGGFAGELNLFARLADDLIVLVGNDRYFMYQNVFAARITGVEGSAGWAAPGDWATLDAALTVQDIRNVSSEGTFGTFEGDRVPNRPWLLGSLGGSLRAHDLARRGDELIVFGNTRYVRAFYRSWESAGLAAFKQVVPSQLVHGAGITYALRGAAPLATTVEVQNLTDARVYDSFGVQRPGRAIYVKLSTEL